MKNVTKICALAAVSLSFLVAACGDDETTSGTPTGSSTTTGGNGGSGGTGGAGGAPGDPPPPALGGQIDRMGRAAIATATYDRFLVTTAEHDTSVDTWNGNANQGTWASTYGASVQLSAAILDGLDGDCTNQPAYAVDLGGGSPTCPADGPAACYGTMAAVLSNDWLVINLDGADDPVYLGIVANFTGAIVNDSTGGRTLEHDAIGTSYGVLSGALGFDDGITAPTPAVLELFPYVAAAN